MLEIPRRNLLAKTFMDLVKVGCAGALASNLFKPYSHLVRSGLFTATLIFFIMGWIFCHPRERS